MLTSAFPLLQVLDDAVEAEQAEQQRLAEDHSETLRALRSQAASTAEVLMNALDSERQQVATLEVSPPRVAMAGMRQTHFSSCCGAA